MLVMKFGGTSVGSASRMKQVAKLLPQNKKLIVVLSAMSGVTNTLVEIAKQLFEKKNDAAVELIEELRQKHLTVVEELYENESFKTKGREMIDSHFDFIIGFTQDSFTLHEEKAVLAQGELLSTALFQFHLEELGKNSSLLPALNYMRIDRDFEPDYYYIQENLQREIRQSSETDIFVTQGFICRNVYGEIDNLKRGGSDYSASLIGAAVKAEEVQIWTDIDGMHNNDPRVVDNTHPIHQLSFDEAAELAYFGAKILHPSSITPAKKANIPVRLKSTMNATAEGTLITDSETGEGIKAVAAKDNITAIKIKSGRMLLAHGFLRKVFEIFEIYKTSIDMITTSEVAVTLTIDDKSNLEKICAELQKYGSVEVDDNQTIICVVGDFISNIKGSASRVFSALQDVPIRMISYGGSRHNISLLVNMEDKNQALKALNKQLF